MKTNPTKTIDELLTALTYIIDIENGRKIYHAWRVSTLAARFARHSTSNSKLKDIFYAGLLQDIGAAGLSFHIIHYLKRNRKSDRYILLSHPIVSAQLVSNIPQMNSAARLILDHHEWINGQGYPRAKLEKNIPAGAQFVRIADSVDIALQTTRPPRLKELKSKLSLNINKEYSNVIFKKALATLNHNRFFYKVHSRLNIPKIFKETKDKVGPMHIPSKIDAIGTTLEVISQIIDMRHPYNSGHSLRVSRYALAIALAMNLEHDDITRLKWAGLIHDIGKFSVSRFIMNKPGELTAKEFRKIKKHAQITQDMMQMMPTLKEIAPIASGHHEYFDGSGYPRGLKGNQIPLGARILVVCDAFDAMTSNRPYRQPLTPQAAAAEIKNLAGRQFDPEIVKVAQPIFINLGL